MPDLAPLDPARTALLVMDYQVAVLDRAPEPEVHALLMAKLLPRQPDVTSVAELVDLLAQR